MVVVSELFFQRSSLKRNDVIPLISYLLSLRSFVLFGVAGMKSLNHG